MNLWLALFLAVPAAADEVPRTMTLEDPEVTEGYFARIVAGVWGSRNFRFSASQLQGESVSSGVEALGSVGIDLGGKFLTHWVAFASAEGDFAAGIEAELLGVALGYRDTSSPDAPPIVPDEVMVYAGPLYGKFHFTPFAAGSFRPSVGGRLGIDLVWKPARGIYFSLAAEWRYIAFDFEQAISQGSTRIGGGTYWVGAGLELRF